MTKRFGFKNHPKTESLQKILQLVESMLGVSKEQSQFENPSKDPLLATQIKIIEDLGDFAFDLNPSTATQD